MTDLVWQVYCGNTRSAWRGEHTSSEHRTNKEFGADECVAYVALNRLDRGVGGDLHVRRAKERGARVAARDRHDRRHHQVLDEGTRDDHLDREPFACWLVQLGSDLLRRLAINKAFDRSQVAHGGHLVLLNPSIVAKEGERGSCLGADDVLHVLHGGLERLADGDVHVLVHLLVVDDDVVHVGGVILGLHLGRGHAVKLANLGRALQHLHAVGVIVDLVLRTRGEVDEPSETRVRTEHTGQKGTNGQKGGGQGGLGTHRRRGEDAAAAERACLVARDARVKVGGRLGTALGVLDLLLRREGHVEEQLRETMGHNIVSVCRDSKQTEHGKGQLSKQIGIPEAARPACWAARGHTNTHANVSMMDRQDGRDATFSHANCTVTL